jgi:hypothetical protein
MADRSWIGGLAAAGGPGPDAFKKSFALFVEFGGAHSTQQ